MRGCALRTFSLPPPSHPSQHIPAHVKDTAGAPEKRSTALSQHGTSSATRGPCTARPHAHAHQALACGLLVDAMAGGEKRGDNSGVAPLIAADEVENRGEGRGRPAGAGGVGAPEAEEPVEDIAASTIPETGVVVDPTKGMCGVTGAWAECGGGDRSTRGGVPETGAGCEGGDRSTREESPGDVRPAGRANGSHGGEGGGGPEVKRVNPILHALPRLPSDRARGRRGKGGGITQAGGTTPRVAQLGRHCSALYSELGSSATPVALLVPSSLPVLPPRLPSQLERSSHLVLRALLAPRKTTTNEHYCC